MAREYAPKRPTSEAGEFDICRAPQRVRRPKSQSLASRRWLASPSQFQKAIGSRPTFQSLILRDPAACVMKVIRRLKGRATGRRAVNCYVYVGQRATGPRPRTRPVSSRWTCIEKQAVTCRGPSRRRNAVDAATFLVGWAKAIGCHFASLAVWHFLYDLLPSILARRNIPPPKPQPSFKSRASPNISRLLAVLQKAPPFFTAASWGTNQRAVTLEFGVYIYRCADWLQQRRFRACLNYLKYAQSERHQSVSTRSENPSFWRKSSR